MIDPRKYTAIILAIPVILFPVEMYLDKLQPKQYFLGLSSQFWSGAMIGFSVVALVVGASTLLLKRKPK